MKIEIFFKNSYKFKILKMKMVDIIKNNQNLVRMKLKLDFNQSFFKSC